MTFLYNGRRSLTKKNVNYKELWLTALIAVFYRNYCLERHVLFNFKFQFILF